MTMVNSVKVKNKQKFEYQWL